MINPLKDNEFYAIRVDQPFGSFYSVVLDSDFLLRRSYSKAAYVYDQANVKGSQRKIKSDKLSEIRGFINNNDAMFPSSIIISANYNENDRLVEEDDRWRVEEIDESAKLYKLIVPNESKVCSIVDGQHRLFGFIGTNKNFDLNCSVYIDLPPSLQASVFATINFNQAPVDKSLAYNLFGYQLDSLDYKYWSPDLLAINFSRILHKGKSSFFSGHINFRLGYSNVEKGFWSISTAAFVDGFVSLISENPNKDRYDINAKSMFGTSGRKAIVDNPKFPLRGFYKDCNDKAIEQVIVSFFDSVKKVFDIDDVSGHIFTKSVGIAALFTTLNKILLKYGVSLGVLDDFESYLRKADLIAFDDSDFYPSSTKGKTRLIRMLEHFILDVEFEDMGIKGSEALAELSTKAEEYRLRNNF